MKVEISIVVSGTTPSHDNYLEYARFPHLNVIDSPFIAEVESMDDGRSLALLEAQELIDRLPLYVLDTHLDIYVVEVK